MGGTEQYEAPVVRDYGDLQQLTAAINGFGPEDGSLKVSSTPQIP